MSRSPDPDPDPAVAEVVTGLVERGLVAMRRPVAEGALMGDLGMLPRGRAIPIVKHQPGQEVVDVRLMQPVLTAIRDSKRFAGMLAGRPNRLGQAMPARPREQDLRLQLHYIDAAATHKGFA